MSRTIRNEPSCSVEVTTKKFNSDRTKKRSFKKEANRAVRHAGRADRIASYRADRVELRTEIPSGSSFKKLCDPRGTSDRIEKPSARHAG